MEGGDGDSGGENEDVLGNLVMLGQHPLSAEELALFNRDPLQICVAIGQQIGALRYDNVGAENTGNVAPVLGEAALHAVLAAEGAEEPVQGAWSGWDEALARTSLLRPGKEPILLSDDIRRLARAASVVYCTTVPDWAGMPMGMAPSSPDFIEVAYNLMQPESFWTPAYDAVMASAWSPVTEHAQSTLYIAGRAMAR